MRWLNKQERQGPRTPSSRLLRQARRTHRQRSWPLSAWMITIGWLLLGLALLLTACAPRLKSATLSSGTELCAAFRPIRASRLDTVDTRQQVAAYNAAGMAACGWKP